MQTCISMNDKRIRSNKNNQQRLMSETYAIYNPAVRRIPSNATHAYYQQYMYRSWRKHEFIGISISRKKLLKIMFMRTQWLYMPEQHVNHKNNAKPVFQI